MNMQPSYDSWKAQENAADALRHAITAYAEELYRYNRTIRAADARASSRETRDTLTTLTTSMIDTATNAVMLAERKALRNAA